MSGAEFLTCSTRSDREDQKECCPGRVRFIAPLSGNEGIPPRDVPDFSGLLGSPA
jgi:hypothetical protein